MPLLLIMLAGYLLGGIPFGYLAGRMQGIDIMKYGSGATGATNVLRLLGTGPAVAVGILDISKGALSAMLAQRVFGPTEYVAPVLAGLAAVAGHSFSPFLRGRGGKGVAVSAGILVALMPQVLAVAVSGFALVVATTRYVSLGSLAGAVIAVTASWVLREPIEYRAFILGGAALIFFQHRSNIYRLLHNKESRLGERVKVL